MNILDIKRFLNFVTIWKMLCETKENENTNLILEKVQNAIVDDFKNVGDLTRCSFDKRKKQITCEIELEEITI